MGKRNFPGGPAVKAPHFHCRGHRFNPWLGNEILQAARPKNRGEGGGGAKEHQRMLCVYTKMEKSFSFLPEVKNILVTAAMKLKDAYSLEGKS